MWLGKWLGVAGSTGAGGLLYIAGTRTYGGGLIAVEGRAVAEFGPVLVAAEVEPRLAVQLEAHLAPHHSDHAHQAAPLGDPPTRNGYEVDHLANAVSVEEAGDQNRRARQYSCLVT
jgi:hypothetical protein